MRMKILKFSMWCVTATILAFCIALVSPALAETKDLGVKVMTRNMYTGADLTIVAGAETEEEFVNAVTEVVGNVLQSGIPERAAAVASEIAVNHPDLVALQEATRWEIQSEYGPIVLDQLEWLQYFLDQAGLHYTVANLQELTDIEVPGAVRYLDRDVILVRSDLPPGQMMLIGEKSGIYDARMVFSVLGNEIQVLRGWNAVDVKIRGARFCFVNTHLEAPLPGIPDTQLLQEYQAYQLLTDLSTIDLPIILTGDFNSDAEPTQFYPPDATASYSMILDAGYTDIWNELHPDDPGFTWPLFWENAGDPADPIERIDLIFTKGLEGISIERTGLSDYASDHAGVAAGLEIYNHRPEVPQGKTSK